MFEKVHIISELNWQIWRDGEVRLKVPFFYFENERKKKETKKQDNMSWCTMKNK